MTADRTPGPSRPTPTSAPGRPRIAVFEPYPLMRGGLSAVVCMLAVSLREQGWPVVVVVPSDGAAAEQYRQAGLPVLCVQAPRGLLRYGGSAARGLGALWAVASLPAYWLRLARVLRQAEIVHIQELRGLILAGPAAKLARRRTLWHVHTWFSFPRFGVDVLVRLFVDRIVVPSATLQELLPCRSLDVVPNSTTRRVRPRLEASDPGPPLILTLARLYPVKGVDVLVEASARLIASGHDHRVAIVGGDQPGYPGYRAQLAAMADGLGMASVVNLEAEVDDPSCWFARADIYVQPSREEGFGLAVLEAMQAGLPVVASDVGGLAELVVHDRTGYLVPSGAPEALADALGKLLADETLRRRFGEAARERVARRFDPVVFAESIITIYGQMGAVRRETSGC